MTTFPDGGAKPQVVCVVGMHRSGTSLAARLLELLGVSLGRPDALLRPGPDNVAGYWENEAIKELNDVILATLGGSWDEPPPLASGWEHSDRLDGHRREAHDALVDAFGERPSTTWIGFKDPRLSLLLPFWRTVTDITTTIVVMRDPIEVMDSLASRNGFGASHSALLWMRYLLAATANDPHHLLVTQSAFFDDLPATLAIIAAHLGLPAPGPDVVSRARGHLDPSLQHHRASSRSASGGSPLTETAESIWNDGVIRLDALPNEVTDAIAQGWLRDPGEDELLAASRAQVVALTEEIRQRNRERDAMLSWRLRLRVHAVRRWWEARTER